VQRLSLEGEAMSETGPTLPEDVHEGWQLGCESWSFHRQFHLRFGRPSSYGEYATILWQIRRGDAEQLDRRYYRATLSDGTTIIVRGGALHLSGVEAPDWTPPRVRKPAAPPAPVAVAAPAAAKPLRASTLTLTNPAAGRVLAERLRRFGVPTHVTSGASPP
jgi:hypothetical protein